jgi:lipopolysaccharide biosynthesis glycosyltransferase
MVPESVDRILYLDCDTVICDSLKELWETDMEGKTIAAIEDVATCIFQSETDSPEPYRYICSGVILIDLKKWRAIDAQQKMLRYLDSRKGVVCHHDQTILNGVFWNDCHILHPRYDALTPTFILSYENLKAYFGIWDRYYTKQEIQESTKKPAIIHYTSSQIGRPWENSKHPKAKIYQKYWFASPWKDEPWGTFHSTYNAAQRRIYWLYRHLPVWFIRWLSR